MYEVDYEHVINKKIGGVEVTIYFSKQKNEKLKDLILGLLLDSYENRMQAYLENCTMVGL